MNIGVVGAAGERMVVSFLRKKGFYIIKQNYQCRFGEIDIIAHNKQYIVFVEVKTRKKNSLVSALEAVDQAKQKRIMLTAQEYIQKNQTDLQPRFDVAEVRVEKGLCGTKKYLINYIENAF